MKNTEFIMAAFHNCCQVEENKLFVKALSLYLCEFLGYDRL